MRHAGGKGVSEGLAGRFSAFDAPFVPVPKSVVLLGLLYALMTSVVYLLGGGSGPAPVGKG